MTYTDEAVERALDAFSPQFDWRKSKLPSADECRRSMRAALSAADAAMEAAGWVRVPVEPTADMIEAPFVGTIEQQDFVMQTKKRRMMAAYYRAMIAARPTTEKEPINEALGVDWNGRQLP